MGIGEILTEKNIERAHKTGCDEVRKALEDLFPSLKLGKKLKNREDITEKIAWENENFGNHNWIVGLIDMDKAFYVKDVKAIMFNHSRYKEEYKIDGDEEGFRIFKK